MSGGGVHGLGSWGCLTAVSGRQGEPGLAPGEAVGPRERLRSSPEELIFPEKLNPTLFVLCSADASTEETAGILFEGELGPRAPSPLTSETVPRLQSLPPNSSEPQTTGMQPGHLGTTE